MRGMLIKKEILHLKFIEMNENVTFFIVLLVQNRVMFPKGEKQEDLMREFYADLKLDPRMVSYIEAHGTGM